MTEGSLMVVLLTTEDSPIHPTAEEILKDSFRIKQITTPRRVIGEELLGELTDADGILVRSADITGKVMEAAPGLKVIGIHGIGVDRVDLEAAEKRGIVVTNTPLANTVAVAEHTFGLILSLIRRIPSSDRLIREGGWKRARLRGKLLMNMTAGIIGLGNIGTKVAKRLRAFEAKVLAYDPYVPLERFEEAGVRSVDLEYLLKESDIVTLHVPLTKFTKHMIGEAELRMMRKEAFIVNTSRGGIIDEEALSLALSDGRISGAALDVFEEEPLKRESPLIQFNNVILTPHAAGSTDESLKRMAETAARDIARVLQGKKPLHQYRRDLLSYPV
jgi:D-3-phosphoglycerate dehydrogenase